MFGYGTQNYVPCYARFDVVYHDDRGLILRRPWIRFAVVEHGTDRILTTIDGDALVEHLTRLRKQLDERKQSNVQASGQVVRTKEDEGRES